MNGSENKIVNFVYDFITPNGYLPFGYQYNTIPHIFYFINDANILKEDNIIKTTKIKNSSFELLYQPSIFSRLKLKDKGVNQILINKLDSFQLLNDSNFVWIDISDKEDINFFLTENSFKTLFSKKTIELISSNVSFKIVINLFDIQIHNYEQLKNNLIFFYKNSNYLNKIHILTKVNLFNNNDYYEEIIIKNYDDINNFIFNYK